MKLTGHGTLVTGISRMQIMNMHLSTTATPDQRINAQYRRNSDNNNKMCNAPKRARIWLQYTTPPGPHIAPFTKNDDAALLRIPAPTIQNNQVTKIQMA